MGETEKLVKAPENGQHMSLLAKLSSWFTGLKAEFNKIIWHRPSGFFDPVWR